LAGEHLLGRGFRRFGFLGFHRDKADANQLIGFNEVLEQSGHKFSSLKFNRNIIEGKGDGWGRFTTELKNWVMSLKKTCWNSCNK